MKNHTKAAIDDTNTLVEDAHVLYNATSDAVEEKVVAARNRIATALDTGRESYYRAREKAVERVRAADHAMHDHPYPSIGIAFGAGVFLGILMAGRR